MQDKQNTEISASEIEAIVDGPLPVFERQSVGERTKLLRLAVEALNATQPETVENLRLSHLLSSWASQLDGSRPPDSECECGNLVPECICDQQAAEDFLATGDGSRLIGLGWHRDVLTELKSGEVTPAALLSSNERHIFQKGASPADILHQSMG